MNKKLIEEYLELFILCIESGGAKDGDEYLLKIEQILEEVYARELLDNFNSVGEGLAIMDVVTLLLLSLTIGKKLTDLDQMDMMKMAEILEHKEEFMEEIKNMYLKYLSRATKDFCKKNNLEIKSNIVKFIEDGGDIFNEKL